jgi:hypothetical protein
LAVALEEVRLTASDEILKGALYAYLYDEKSSAHTKALSAFASDPRFAPLLRKALHLIFPREFVIMRL